MIGLAPSVYVVMQGNIFRGGCFGIRCFLLRADGNERTLFGHGVTKCAIVSIGFFYMFGHRGCERLLNLLLSHGFPIC